MIACPQKTPLKDCPLEQYRKKSKVMGKRLKDLQEVFDDFDDEVTRFDIDMLTNFGDNTGSKAPCAPEDESDIMDMLDGGGGDYFGY